MSMLLCGSNNPRNILQTTDDTITMAREVDFDVNVTGLYAAIGQSDWAEASHACNASPIEAETWVIRRERDSETGIVLGPDAGNILWRFLPLHSACARNPPASFVRDLIRANPDAACIKDDQGMYALHYACGNRACRGVVRQLLEAYPRVARQTDPNGMLPLHYLASWGQSERGIVDMLLEANTDALTARDKDGLTPIDIAKEGAYEGWQEVVEAIEGAYAVDESDTYVPPRVSHNASFSSTFDVRWDPKDDSRKQQPGHFRGDPVPPQRSKSRGRSPPRNRRRAVSASPRHTFSRYSSEEVVEVTPSESKGITESFHTPRNSNAYATSHRASEGDVRGPRDPSTTRTPRGSPGQRLFSYSDETKIERRDAASLMENASVDERREMAKLISNFRRDTDAADARAKAAETRADRKEAEIDELRSELSKLRAELIERDTLTSTHNDTMTRLDHAVRDIKSTKEKLVSIVDTAGERESRRILVAEERKARLQELIRAEELDIEAEVSQFKCEGGATIGMAFEKQLVELDAIRKDMEKLRNVRNHTIAGGRSTQF